MRTYLPRVAGNEALRARLGATLATGAFSHAYIIEGRRGSGKRAFALETAMAAVCEQRGNDAVPLPCGVCPTCRKILAGNCPDIMHVGREAGKASMGVEAARGVRANLAAVPNDLDLKIYIIEDAHTMTAQAQNALLFSLEEPPPFVLFLLLTEDAGALLETVRSRAETLRLCPLSEREITDFLLSPARDAAVRHAATELRESDPATFAAVLKHADGNIGTALELLDPAQREPLMAARATATELCRLLAARVGGEAWIAPLASLGNTRDSVTAGLSLFRLALRDLILLTREEGAPLLFFTEREQALSLAARVSATRLFAVHDAVEQTLASLAANANARLAVANLQGRILH